MNKFTLAVAAFALSAGTAMAATYTPINLESNGNRPGAGTDQSGGAVFIDGSPINNGDNVGIAGRIVNAVDQFLFEATANWSIKFVDLGIDDQKYFDSSDVVETGDPCPGTGCASNGDITTAVFSILDANNGNAVIDSVEISATPGGEATKHLLHFAGGAGSYILKIDGNKNNRSGDGDTTSNPGATYDIGISTVPLPAAGWMLIAGVGGIAAMKRRKKKS